MTQEADWEFHRRRAREEEKRAMEATQAVVSQAHKTLAEHHKVKAVFALGEE